MPSSLRRPVVASARHRTRRSKLTGPLPPELVHVSTTRLRFGRRELVNFGGSDYFRLGWHPAVRESLSRTARDIGHGFGASRRTTGNHPSYSKLEEELAAFAGFPTALLSASGYSAPMVAAQGLAAKHTHVLVDGKAHACLHDAACLSGLPVSVFRHRDMAGLHKAIRHTGHGSRILLMTDGLSAHLGQVFPVTDYLAALPPNGTLLLDDAHGLFVLGNGGRGTLEHLALVDQRVVLTGTLSKALGAFGGVIFCSQQQREQMIKRSRLFASGSPLSLVFVAAALTALNLLKRDGNALRKKLETNTRGFREPINLTGIEAAQHIGPVFSCAPASPTRRQVLKSELLTAGIYPTLIQYAGGPADFFFRFAISTAHLPEQLQNLKNVLTRFVAPMKTRL